jgi:hypothetical protein
MSVTPHEVPDDQNQPEPARPSADKSASLAVERGISHFHKGEFDLAIEYFNQAIASDPRDRLAVSNRGSVFFRKGEYQRALADFSRLIELNPDNGDAYYKRMRTYQELGLQEQAAEDRRRAIMLTLEAERRKSIAVTISGFMFSTVGVAGIGMMIGVAPLLSDVGTSVWRELSRPIGLAVLAVIAAIPTGVAIIRRWPGWRFLAGIVAWCLIVDSAMGLQVALALTRPYPLTGPAWASLAAVVGSFATAIAAFALWAKRQEPRPHDTDGRCTEVTVAGSMLLVFFAIFVLVIGVSGSSSGVTPALASYYLTFAIFGLTGLAIIRRWRGWRIWAGVVSWVMIAVGLFAFLGFFMNMATAPLSNLLGAEFFIAAFAFVLWAKRREPKIDPPSRHPAAGDNPVPTADIAVST